MFGIVSLYMSRPPSNRRYRSQNVFEKSSHNIEFWKSKKPKIFRVWKSKNNLGNMFTGNYLFCFATGIWTLSFALQNISHNDYIFKI